MSKTCILIVSYSKDLPYLRFNLRSINKFGTGFSGVTLVVPSQEASDFASLAASENCDLRTYERTEDKTKWQIHAQVQKCMADVHCPNADFILHTDSDCIFTELVCPEDYMRDGKPFMLMEDYSRLKGNPWKGVTQDCLKMTVKYEFMRAHPQVNPCAVYPALRNYLEFLHKMPFETFVLSRPGGFPFSFTEHNIIGAYAYRFMNSAYHWIDLGKEKAPPEKLRQFWSMAPIDKKQPSPHGEPECTPLEIIQKILSA